MAKQIKWDLSLLQDFIQNVESRWATCQLIPDLSVLDGVCQVQKMAKIIRNLIIYYYILGNMFVSHALLGDFSTLVPIALRLIWLIGPVIFYIL